MKRAGQDEGGRSERGLHKHRGVHAIHLAFVVKHRARQLFGSTKKGPGLLPKRLGPHFLIHWLRDNGLMKVGNAKCVRPVLGTNTTKRSKSDHRTPTFYWRAQQDLNLRPTDS